MTRLGRKVEDLLSAREWAKCRQVLRVFLKKRPNDHWSMMKMSTAYYAEERYAQALRWSDMAMRQRPRCPMVLWQHAANLREDARTSDAIAIYRGLLRQRLCYIAYGECGGGVRWTRRLLNDCRLCLADCYLELGDVKRAKYYLRSHMQRRVQTGSLYGVTEVNELSRIVSGRADVAQRR